MIGYLDPASGSILASAIVGGTAAIGVAAKSFRHKLTGKLKRKSAAEELSMAPADDVTVESTTDA